MHTGQSCKVRESSIQRNHSRHGAKINDIVLFQYAETNPLIDCLLK